MLTTSSSHLGIEIGRAQSAQSLFAVKLQSVARHDAEDVEEWIRHVSSGSHPCIQISRSEGCEFMSLKCQ